MGGFDSSWQGIINPLSIALAFLLLGVFASKLLVSRIAKTARLLGHDINERLLILLKQIVLIVALAIGFYWVLDSYFGNSLHFTQIHKAYVSVLIITLTIFGAQALITLIEIYATKMGKTFANSSILVNITRGVVYLLGALTCMSFWGINIAPLLTALGVTGLAVALALQETLSNLFAGINIIASNKIALGDYIRMDDGVEGTVTDISWRSTTILALNNSTTIVPNSKMAAAVVINFFLDDKEMNIPVEVGVAYDSDLEHVERVTLETARESLQNVIGAVSDFEPRVRFVRLGDFSIDIVVILRVSEYIHQYALRHDFIKRLHARYAKEGIVIPFPTRIIHNKTFSS